MNLIPLKSFWVFWTEYLQVQIIHSTFTTIIHNTMAIPSDSPRVALLKQEFEKEFGRPVRTPRDFTDAVSFVFEKTNEMISDSTFRRLYKETKKYKHVSDDILNILSRTIGYKHFQDFCEYLSSSGIKDSELSCGDNYIKADELAVGDRIYIAWLPDRECSLKYLGNYRFEVDEVVNASIVKGDRFSCRCFTQNKCLLVDNLEHDGKRFESYVMGKANGLTCVKKV